MTRAIQSLSRYFPSRGLLYDVRRAVLAAIASDSYLVRLPDVSHTSWVKYDWFERKRLDYLGDGLMYAFVAEALIEMYPNEGSFFYSVSA